MGELNSLPSFHFIENYVNNIMHTLSQGSIPRVMSGVVSLLKASGQITIVVILLISDYFKFFLRQLSIEK